MKASDIKVGGLYRAMVNGMLTVVKVTAIRDGGSDRVGGSKMTRYDVTNTKTGRKTTFRSAAKFREPVDTNDALVAGGAKLVKTLQTPSATATVEAEQVTPGKVLVTTTVKPVSAFAEAMRNKGQVGPVDTAPHLIVKALAGTGKTTTCIEGMKDMLGRPTSITPSPQQAAIWECLRLSRGKATTIGMVAFNSAIADELKRKVPLGVDAMTAHSLGLRAVKARFTLRSNNGRKDDGGGPVNKFRTEDITADLLGKSGQDLRREQPLLVPAVAKLVSLCKMNLIGLDYAEDDERWGDDLEDLASHYEVEVVSEDGRHNVKDAAFELVPKVLERCKDVGRDRYVNFDDMVWLPIALNLPVTPYDVMFVDECQDLNRCTQELVCRSGRRLVFVGDENQAIYGFAGADAESMKRLEHRLGGDRVCIWPNGEGTKPHEFDETGVCINELCNKHGDGQDRGVMVLPLTMTRRCGKAIVAEARQMVQGFEAAPTNGDGKVTHLTWESGEYRKLAKPGDMILCRTNAPLVSECFRFIKLGVRANIAGRDIGKGLRTLVTKLCHGNPALPVPEFIKALEEWSAIEMAKEQARKRPNESKIIAIDDKFSCLVCFTDGAKTAGDVLSKIDSLFVEAEDVRGAPVLLLSSIHKSKGLEAQRVFLLEPERATVPHPMAKSEWQKVQEWNLRYVAVTRAIGELVYVKQTVVSNEWGRSN